MALPRSYGLQAQPGQWAMDASEERTLIKGAVHGTLLPCELNA